MLRVTIALLSVARESPKLLPRAIAHFVDFIKKKKKEEGRGKREERRGKRQKGRVRRGAFIDILGYLKRFRVKPAHTSCIFAKIPP